MKKLMLSCIALLLMVSLVGCANNVDKDTSKPDKTEQKEDDAKTALKEIQENLDSKKKITATLNNKATIHNEGQNDAKFTEEATYSSDNDISVIDAVFNIIGEGDKVASSFNLKTTVTKDGFETEGVMGAYPFGRYPQKLSEYLDTDSEITVSEVESNKQYEFSIKLASVSLEVDSNNMPVKLVIVEKTETVETTLEFTNFTFE